MSMSGGKYTMKGKPSGPSGAKPSKPPRSGNVGANGSSNVESLSELKAIATQTEASSELYATIALRDAESNYANEQFNDAKRELEWLHAMLDSESRLNADEDLGSSAMSQDALLERVQGLLLQLGLGMDYFGRSQNFAPPMSHEYYEQRLEQLCMYAVEFEVLRNTFIDARDDTRTQLNTTRSGIDQKGIIADQARAEAALHLQTAERLNDEILELATSLASLHPECMRLAEELRVEIERAAEGCNLSDALSIVATVATAATAIKTGGATAIAGGRALWDLGSIQNSSFDDGMEALSARLKLIGKVGEGVREVAKGFEDIREALEPSTDLEPPALPNEDDFDSVKLLQSQADLDATLDPLRHEFGHAEELRIAFDAYVQAAISRNNKMLEQLHARANAKSARARALLVEQEIEDLREMLVVPESSNVWFYNEFFEQSHRDNIESLTRALYSYSNAIDWWSGKVGQRMYSGPTALWYENALQRERDRVTRHLELLGQEFQDEPILAESNPGERYLDFSIGQDFGHHTLSALREQGACTFHIPLDFISENRRFVRATQVQIVLSGIEFDEERNERGRDPITLILSNLGVGAIIDSSSRVMRRHFGRRDVLVSVLPEHWSSQIEELGGSQRYTDPPLAGLWRLEIAQRHRHRLKMSETFAATIRFATTFKATPSFAQK